MHLTFDELHSCGVDGGVHAATLFFFERHSDPLDEERARIAAEKHT